jgi:hypothetical protein
LKSNFRFHGQRGASVEATLNYSRPPESDLVFQCVTELFKKDPDDPFVIGKQGFAALQILTKNDPECLDALALRWLTAGRLPWPEGTQLAVGKVAFALLRLTVPDMDAFVRELLGGALQANPQELEEARANLEQVQTNLVRIRASGEAPAEVEAFNDAPILYQLLSEGCTAGDFGSKLGSARDLLAPALWELNLTFPQFVSRGLARRNLEVSSAGHSWELAYGTKDASLFETMLAVTRACAEGGSAMEVLAIFLRDGRSPSGYLKGRLKPITGIFDMLGMVVDLLYVPPLRLFTSEETQDERVQEFALTETVLVAELNPHETKAEFVARLGGGITEEILDEELDGQGVGFERFRLLSRMYHEEGDRWPIDYRTRELLALKRKPRADLVRPIVQALVIEQ